MSTTLTPPTKPDASSGDDRGRTAWDAVRTYSPPGRYLPVIATAVLFLALFGLGGLRFDNFVDNPQAFLNLFIDNAYLFVLAVGLTFVILTGGIDLSVGSVVALSTMILAKGLGAGWGLELSMLAVLVTATVLGTLMGMLIHYLDVQPFIATLAGLFLARGISFVISTTPVPITDPSFGELSYTPIYLKDAYYIRWSVIIALVVAVVAALVLAFTRFGRTVYAIGGNESSAMLMGLRVAAAKVGVYSISGFCAGVAGILFCLNLPAGNSRNGIGLELDAIAAVVIGGTLLAGGRGLVVGSLLGVLVLGTIRQLITLESLNAGWTRVATGGLLLVFVIIQRFLTRRQT